MKNYYDLPSPKRLEMIIKSKGISSRDLSKALYGQKTHRDVVVELSTKKDPRSSTIVRISRILQVPLDALFVDEEIPVNGGESALSGTDQGRLQLQDLEKQIEILKAVINEKDKRIDDLKELTLDLNKRIISLLEERRETYDNIDNK